MLSCRRISQTYWIAIAAVKVNLNFVVKANVNIQIGAEMEYQVGKRYSFWLHLMGKTSGNRRQQQSKSLDRLAVRIGRYTEDSDV